MDLNLLTRDADNLIRKVVSRYNQLYAPSGQISQVELDLMLDDLRRLYDTFKTIGQVNLTLQQGQVKPQVTVGTPMQTNTSDVTQLTSPAAEQDVTPAVARDFKPENTAGPIAETTSEPTSETLAEPEDNDEQEQEVFSEKEPEIPAASASYEPQAVENHNQTAKQLNETHPTAEDEETEIQSSEKQETGLLADKFNVVNKSLSETIAASAANNFVGGRMQFQPISDLATGIGLNDKFTFINELFGNNPAQYEEAIARINKAVNADEAGWILQKYHSAEWQNKTETLQRLKDFVKRRFI